MPATRNGSASNPPRTLPSSLASLRTRQFAFSKRSSPQSLLPTWIPAYYQTPHPNDDDWTYWALIAGRGTGKTDAGAHYVDRYALEHAGCRIAIIAPTMHDARSVCVEGETGLLAANPRIEFNRGWGELKWPNGTRGQLFGAYTPEDVERLRGPQHHLVWCDEFAAWRQIKECWDMMRLGLRLGPKPRAIITTTPKPRPTLKEILADTRTVIALTQDGRRPTTDDNPHLHPDVRKVLYDKYQGTRLGRQELNAEDLDDVPGALWQRKMLDEGRIDTLPDMQRVVVAIDPAVTSGEDSDETGIVVCGRGVDGHGYVLADRTCKLSPDAWARRAVQAYEQFHADRIIAEVNNGGDLVERVIRTVGGHYPYRPVRASRGKLTRAEPVAALYEQGKVHHVGSFPELEDQMCMYTPDGYDGSPDRVDALVWALTDLMLTSTEVKFY